MQNLTTEVVFFYKQPNVFCFFTQKKRETLSNFSLCTQSRDRTGMEVNPLVFETSASTNSAIWAIINS